jgi:hypothetical protein
MSILSEKKLTHLQKAREARKQKDIEIREKAKKYDELKASYDTLNSLTENITRKQEPIDYDLLINKVVDKLKPLNPNSSDLKQQDVSVLSAIKLTPEMLTKPKVEKPKRKLFDNSNSLFS